MKSKRSSKESKQLEVIKEIDRTTKERNQVDQDAVNLYVKSADVRQWHHLNNLVKDKDKHLEFLRNKLYYTTMAELKK